MTNFIIAQCFSLISFIIVVFALQCKDKNKIIYYFSISNLFLVCSLIFLGSLSAIVLGCIATIRTFCFYWLTKYNKKKTLLVLFIIFEIINVVSIFFTYVNGWDILLLSAYLLYTFGMWQPKKNIFLACNLYMSVVFIIFNLLIAGYVNAAQETFVIVSVLIALVRDRKALKTKKIIEEKIIDKDETEDSTQLQKN